MDCFTYIICTGIISKMVLFRVRLLYATQPFDSIQITFSSELGPPKTKQGKGIEGRELGGFFVLSIKKVSKCHVSDIT